MDLIVFFLVCFLLICSANVKIWVLESYATTTEVVFVLLW